MKDEELRTAECGERSTIAELRSRIAESEKVRSWRLRLFAEDGEL